MEHVGVHRYCIANTVLVNGACGRPQILQFIHCVGQWSMWASTDTALQTLCWSMEHVGVHRYCIANTVLVYGACGRPQIQHCKHCFGLWSMWASTDTAVQTLCWSMEHVGVHRYCIANTVLVNGACGPTQIQHCKHCVRQWSKWASTDTALQTLCLSMKHVGVHRYCIANTVLVNGACGHPQILHCKHCFGQWSKWASTDTALLTLCWSMEHVGVHRYSIANTVLVYGACGRPQIQHCKHCVGLWSMWASTDTAVQTLCWSMEHVGVHRYCIANTVLVNGALTFLSNVNASLLHTVSAHMEFYFVMVLLPWPYKLPKQ